MSEEKACRGCSDCRGAEHHWLENPDFGNGGEEDAGGDGPPLHPDFTHVCKHCPAVGGECPRCDGDGSLTVPAFEEDDRREECGYCKGHGIVEGQGFTDWRG